MQIDKIQAVKTVEEIRRGQIFESRRREADKEVDAEMAAHFSKHPAGTLAELRRVIKARKQGEALQRALDDCKELRRNFMLDCPDLCSEVEIHLWQDLMVGKINLWRAIGVMEVEEKTRAFGEGSSHAKSEYEHAALHGTDSVAMAANEFRTLSRANLPPNLGMKQLSVHPMSVAVTNSNAQVIINSSIHQIGSYSGTITREGNADVSKGIDQLAEALRLSPLADEVKAEKLEVLSEIASHAANPEKPSRSVMRALLGGFQIGLSNAANVSQVLDLVGPILGRHLGVPWPL